MFTFSYLITVVNKTHLYCVFAELWPLFFAVPSLEVRGPGADSGQIGSATDKKGGSNGPTQYTYICNFEL